MTLKTFLLTLLTALAFSLTAQAAEQNTATEATEVAANATQQAAVEPATADAKAPAQSKVNINTATAKELENLSGVGPKTAEKIVTYRQEHGEFASVEQLRQVPGIGDKKLAAIQDMISVK
jgi:competence protein ComEA